MIIGVFAGASALALVTAGVLALWTLYWLQGTATAEGTVIAVTDRIVGSTRSSSSPSWAVVAFAASDGRRFEFRTPTGHAPPPYRVGETVTVRYQPDAPASAGLNAFYSLWWWPLNFAAIGVFLVLLTGVVALVLTLLRKLSQARPPR